MFNITGGAHTGAVQNVENGHLHIYSVIFHSMCISYTLEGQTRSQAVARIADYTASQHLWGSRDDIGHMTICYPECHFLLVVLWNQASICNSFRDIQRGM